MTGRNAYHVTIASLFPGDVIAPGRHAAQYRQYRPGGPMPKSDFITNLLWELALETARVAGAPDKPSRLASVYAWEELEAARLFQARRGPNASILAVEFDEDVPVYRGDFDLISSGNPTEAYVDYLSEIAARYWLEAPIGTVELIVAGPIRVTAIVP